jgi:hypothetical protein
LEQAQPCLAAHLKKEDRLTYRYTGNLHIFIQFSKADLPDTINYEYIGGNNIEASVPVL